VVVVGADRHLSGLLAERRFHCTVHLLDDGFQHVQLRRDVDIVLLVPDDLAGRVLPDGRLREDLSALRRAHAIVVNSNSEVDLQAVAEQTGVAPIFRASTRLLGWGLGVGSGLGGGASPAPRPAPTPSPDPVIAVAGIARPRRFFDLLAASGWRIAREITFGDHHWFTRSDLDRVVKAAVDVGAACIVMTQKDLVRLLPFRPFPVPIVAPRLEMTIDCVAQPGRELVPFSDWLVARLAAARGGSGHPASLEQPA
jgi:tetraacyldisaccharide 4'-kinase